MKQQVHYVQADDGVKLAWNVTGRGPPLVKAATWLTHLQYDRESPVWAHWVRFLGDHYSYLRYDERGCGMSDWNAGDLTLPRWVEDLETVVDAVGIDRPFALLGISQGAATAIGYAVRHPRRVSHLVLYGGYAAGGLRSDDPQRAALFRAVMEVVGLGWGSDNPAFRRLFTERFAPDGTAEQLDWFNQLCRQTTAPENAVALLQARGNVDIREQLDQVRVPTLVLHANRDHIAPIAQGRLLASRIAGARFVELDSSNHVLLEHEPAWRDFQEALLAFTGVVRPEARLDPAREAVLTAREREVLALLCGGRSNAQIGWELGVAEKTVRNHVSGVYRKLGVRSRAEAIVQVVGRHGPG